MCCPWCAPATMGGAIMMAHYGLGSVVDSSLTSKNVNLTNNYAGLCPPHPPTPFVPGGVEKLMHPMGTTCGHN